MINILHSFVIKPVLKLNVRQCIVLQMQNVPNIPRDKKVKAFGFFFFFFLRALIQIRTSNRTIFSKVPRSGDMSCTLYFQINQ